jgi:hypothetical protein
MSEEKDLVEIAAYKELEQAIDDVTHGRKPMLLGTVNFSGVALPGGKGCMSYEQAQAFMVYVEQQLQIREESNFISRADRNAYTAKRLDLEDRKQASIKQFTDAVVKGV